MTGRGNINDGPPHPALPPSHEFMVPGTVASFLSETMSKRCQRFLKWDIFRPSELLNCYEK